MYKYNLHEFFGILAEELCYHAEISEKAMTVWVDSPRDFALKYFAEYASDFNNNITMRFYKIPTLIDEDDSYVLIKGRR